MAKIKDIYGKWLFITPIDKLILTDAVNKELSINNVIFIDSSKFLRVRKRFGIDFSTKDIKKFLWEYDFFSKNNTVAIIHHTGIISENNCMNMVKEALNILASSQLVYVKRKSIRIMSPMTMHEQGSNISLFLSKDEGKYKQATFKRYGSILSYDLDKHWIRFQKQGFFLNLLKIINKKIVVDKKWRGQLIKVANLIGKSLMTDEPVESFLWNMIALETLLLRQGDKYLQAMPERIDSILGWMLDIDYHSKYLEGIYKKRNRLVHDGDSTDIFEEDIIFVDGILFNLLMNILKHPKIFHSKDALIGFAERIKAENILGMKSRTRPKGLSYIGMPPRMRE